MATAAQLAKDALKVHSEAIDKQTKNVDPLSPEVKGILRRVAEGLEHSKAVVTEHEAGILSADYKAKITAYYSGSEVSPREFFEAIHVIAALGRVITGIYEEGAVGQNVGQRAR